VEDAGIKATHAPACGRRVAGFDLGVVDFRFQRVAIDVEGATRSAPVGDLEQSGAGSDLVADAKVPNRNASSSEVLTEGAIEEGIAARHKVVDDFGCYEKNGFVGATVDGGVVVAVTFQSEGSNEAFRNGAFRKASERDVDLNDGTLHCARVEARRQAKMPAPQL